jgi:hypothetical protein
MRLREMLRVQLPQHRRGGMIIRGRGESHGGSMRQRSGTLRRMVLQEYG